MEEIQVAQIEARVSHLLPERAISHQADAVLSVRWKVGPG
jgi:hypothetical protein